MVLETSWRARPGSFVSLMTLVREQFRASRLAGARFARRHGRASLEGPPRTVISISSPVELVALHQCVPAHLCEFDLEGTDPVFDPDLEVCVYHDARLAEVRKFRGFQRHPQLSKLESGAQA